MGSISKEQFRDLLSIRLPELKWLTTNRPKAKREIGKRLREILATKVSGRHFRSFWKSKSRAHGGLFYLPWKGLGRANNRVEFMIHPSRKGAEAWLDGQLRENRKRFTKDTNMMLPVRYEEFLPIFLKHGFYITEVLLFGKPRQAYTRLMKTFSPPDNLDHLSLQIRPFGTAADSRAVMNLEERWFKRHPEFAWELDRELLDWLRKWRAREARKSGSQNGQFVVCDGKKILGYFGMAPQFNPVGSRIGGVGLIFSREIQGLGISKVAYRLVLEKMISSRLQWFRGATAQKAVMKMGKVMGRKKVGILLRYGKGYFPKGHFNY